MAKENEDGQEKSEEPTQERRDEFRQKGDIAVSRDLTSVFVFAGAIAFLSFTLPKMYDQLANLVADQFRNVGHLSITEDNFIIYMTSMWTSYLRIIGPVFLLTMVSATAVTFFQTRLNFSMKRVAPNFKKFNILKGLAKMVSGQSLMELTKGICKMFAVGTISYLILRSEWDKVPSLLNLDILDTFGYWGQITKYLFWSVSAMLLLIACGDYIYNFITMENQMKMTKKEVKEEYKKREVDPHVKGRMRRMQREIVNSKMITSSKQATVLITNPTHYSIAIKYELGMPAPLVVAKGIDFLALRMREVAKEENIPIIENRPLARTLYKLAEPGDEIPDSLYKAISEVIRYVFKMKGIKINKEADA